MEKKCEECGKKILGRVRKSTKFCSRECYHKWMKKNKLPNKTSFKKGMVPHNKGKSLGYICSGGYKKYSVNGKQIHESHLVYMSATGIKNIPDGMDIHHINGNKTDNDINNLMMLSKSDHARLHWLLGKKHPKRSKKLQ